MIFKVTIEDEINTWGGDHFVVYKVTLQVALRLMTTKANSTEKCPPF
jgi:hypothetical protein